MFKRLFSIASVLMVASIVFSACTGSAPDVKTIKIVSSLPMTGTDLPQTKAIVNANTLRIDQSNGAVCDGKYKLVYEAWDAPTTAGQWDPAVETENAKKAAADKSVIAYLGTYNSDAAKLSIPILNQAGPLLMISPTNTNPGLTKADKELPGVTAAYYPTGIRSYARVIPTDDIQGRVAANFVKGLGAQTVYILNGQQTNSMGIADFFKNTAMEIGLTVVGYESIDPTATSYKDLITRISTSNAGKAPDAIYVGMIDASKTAQLLKDKVALMGNNTLVKFIGPNVIQTQTFIDDAGTDVAEGVYTFTAKIPLDKLPASGQQFVKDYEARYNKLTEPYAAYGYETMSVIIKAIENVCAAGGNPTDRATINKAVFSIKDFDGILGNWSFDANGDTTLADIGFYQVQNGKYIPIGTFK
jgi:branched-chain amino acid transport system substrate-binding protein